MFYIFILRVNYETDTELLKLQKKKKETILNPKFLNIFSIDKF